MNTPHVLLDISTNGLTELENLPPALRSKTIEKLKHLAVMPLDVFQASYEKEKLLGISAPGCVVYAVRVAANSETEIVAVCAVQGQLVRIASFRQVSV